tara:strand:+ start:11141 stop:11872 length:732 start_codon:yes stop_codon:yes gene_type:complete
MRLSRVYLQQEIINSQTKLTISKDAEQYNYITKVLRLKNNHQVIIFNNSGYDFLCELINITNKFLELNIIEKNKNHSESNFKIHLAQAISKPSHFELTLQKSVELGVTEITPVISDYSETLKYSDKKADRFKKIIISACEQSNRSIIPNFNNPVTFNDFINNNSQSVIIMPTPRATKKFDVNLLNNIDAAIILVGCEGGFSEKEESLSRNSNSHLITLGPRILRTETAGISLISILQFLKGDL